MKPKYKVNDRVWTYHEGAHFSPLLATIEEVTTVDRYWSLQTNEFVKGKSNFYKMMEGCSFYRAETALFSIKEEALIVCNEINARRKRERELRDRFDLLLDKGITLDDGIYDVTDMVYFEVRDEDREAAIEYIEAHKIFYIANAYETDKIILFSKKPHSMSSEWCEKKWIGSGFNYGSTNLLRFCPRDILIAEND